MLIFVLLEFSSILLVEYFDYSSRPKYWRKSVSNQYPKNADIDTFFGVWHIPNTSFHHVSDCFDVYNYYNSYGARDIERAARFPDNRIFMIGDSFIEGLGVDTSQRLSNIIERELQIDVLNFGTSGNFGSTQMRILYEIFGDVFDHNITSVGLFPTNDFDDDSFEYGKKYHSTRYRPYTLNGSDGYNTFYYGDSLHKSDWFPDNIFKEFELQKINWRNGNTLIGALRHFTYTYQMLSFIKNSISEPNNPFSSKHEHFSQIEIDLLLYNLSVIDSLSIGNDSKLVVFSIPSLEDIRHNRGHFGLKKLGMILSKFCEDRNITYIDLLSYQSNIEAFDQLFFDCDGHWSVEGNKNAASILSKYVKTIVADISTGSDR